MTRCCASPADAWSPKPTATAHPDHRFNPRRMAVLFATFRNMASTVELPTLRVPSTTRKPILPRFTVGAGANAAGAERRGRRIAPPAEEGLVKRLV